MAEPKRYTPMWNAGVMEEYEGGEFVRLCDYTTLSHERDQALSAHADMVAELEASRAEFERLRKVEADAMRYRWLREHCRFANDSDRELWFDACIVANDESEILDRIIDRLSAEACGRKG